ncbi:hypothetical protein [Pseudanabaena sp. FACHB-2040]|uniref:hypothetical protein n=1 Tax=Pseudanabaena sp. FACHB-2040 TaxID=2692859 RepID=UPI001683257B|nr:hypothetical protein [Pseudanabaena sp. FACHB-2040]MBD2256676.1 hypothetical protein [Pseudanabaena sp. FACHB-2040]
MSRFKFIANLSHSRLATLGLLAAVISGGIVSQASTLAHQSPLQSDLATQTVFEARNVRANRSEAQVPPLVRNRVIRRAAQDTRLPLQGFNIIQASAEIWPDGCLGIPNPVALCAAVQTRGWRVEVSHGDVIRVYRTDAAARVIEEEPTDSNLLPRLTASRVLDEIIQTSGLPLEQLNILAAEPRTWDGCFGLPPSADSMCTMIAIPGWRVVVTAPQHVWVYHTNQDGTEIRLNEVASQIKDATVIPDFIEAGARPLENEVDPEALVTVTKSGGIAGHTEKTVLFQDGRLVRYPHSGSASSSPVLLRQVSPEEVNAFVQQMQAAQIDRFEGLRYSAPAGTADHFTVTMLFGRYSMTQYDDAITAQLPRQLQRAIQNWDTFATPAP